MRQRGNAYLLTTNKMTILQKLPRGTNHFSLLGGTSPFSRMYNASVAYCSLSCEIVPQAIPSRERLAGPACTISVIFASVSEPNALSHSAKEALSASTIVALSAVSSGAGFGLLT